MATTNSTAIDAVNTLTITGNTDDAKAVASILELGAKTILSAGDDELLFARTAATAEQINNYGGWGTGVYKVPAKVAAMTNYDPDTGTKKQRTQVMTTIVVMDQHITMNVWFEDFDMTRFLESGPNERAKMLQQWTYSGVKNIQLTKEATFLRGMIDYSKAMTYKRPQNVQKLALPTTPEEARGVYNAVQDLVIKWRKDFTRTAFGISKKDVNTIISLEMYNALATQLPNFLLNAETFKIYATGNLYEDKILGTATRQHNMLNSKYSSDDDTKINGDVTFDFTGVHILLYGADNWAMPQGMVKSRFLEDNDTLSLKWIWKEMIGLPESIRPLYTAIFIDSDLTDDMIKAAQGQAYTGTKFGLEESYQLANYDKDFGQASDLTVNKDGTVTLKDGTIVKSAYVGAGKAASNTQSK